MLLLPHSHDSPTLRRATQRAHHVQQRQRQAEFYGGLRFSTGRSDFQGPWPTFAKIWTVDCVLPWDTQPVKFEWNPSARCRSAHTWNTHVKWHRCLPFFRAFVSKSHHSTALNIFCRTWCGPVFGSACSGSQRLTLYRTLYTRLIRSHKTL
jgi:hypothetical protein